MPKYRKGNLSLLIHYKNPIYFSFLSTSAPDHGERKKKTKMHSVAIHTVPIRLYHATMDFHDVPKNAHALMKLCLFPTES